MLPQARPTNRPSDEVRDRRSRLLEAFEILASAAGARRREKVQQAQLAQPTTAATETTPEAQR